MQRPRRRRRRRNDNEFRPTREKEKVEEEKNTTQQEELRTTHSHTHIHKRTTQVAKTTTKYLSSQLFHSTHFLLSRPPRTTLKSTCSHRHDE